MATGHNLDFGGTTTLMSGGKVNRNMGDIHGARRIHAQTLPGVTPSAATCR